MSKKNKQKKAEKQVKKYYGEKTSDVETKAATDTKRYQEDLQRIMNESGLAQTRATEDYIRNIGNLEANKAADVADVNDYVSVNKGRTQEDLDTSLAKETRRFSIESDKINEDLSARGMTFSDRKDEKIAQEGSALNTKDIQTTAQRSFQDIARYETARNRDIQLKYGQAETEAGVTKTRNIEDILNDQAKKAQGVQRGTEDVAFGKATDIRDINYQREDTLSGIQNFYDAQKASLKRDKMILNVKGA
jgi:hypothetical protein